MQKSLILGDAFKEGPDLQNLMRSHTVLTCGIAVQNWTNTDLSSPHYTSFTGMLSIPPTSIPSGTIQAVVRSIKHNPFYTFKKAEIKLGRIKTLAFRYQIQHN